MNDELAEYVPGSVLKSEPEIGVQINAPSELDVCTWTDDVDEKRRAFVVNQMAYAEVDGKILVENMHRVCEWLRTGELPAQTNLKQIR